MERHHLGTSTGGLHEGGAQVTGGGTTDGANKALRGAALRAKRQFKSLITQQTGSRDDSSNVYIPTPKTKPPNVAGIAPPLLDGGEGKSCSIFDGSSIEVCAEALRTGEGPAQTTKVENKRTIRGCPLGAQCRRYLRKEGPNIGGGNGQGLVPTVHNNTGGEEGARAKLGRDPTGDGHARIPTSKSQRRESCGARTPTSARSKKESRGARIRIPTSARSKKESSGARIPTSASSKKESCGARIPTSARTNESVREEVVPPLSLRANYGDSDDSDDESDDDSACDRTTPTNGDEGEGATNWAVPPVWTAPGGMTARAMMRTTPFGRQGRRG